jgi:magnesium transporter
MGKAKQGHRRRGIGKHLSSRSRKAGMPPGSLVYIGSKTGAKQARITAIEYDGQSIVEREVDHPAELLPLKPAPAVTWINVDSIQDETLLGEFGQVFELSPLLLEDILNTEQRPKYEFLDNRIYIILKMFDFDTQHQEFFTEQVSIVIGPNFLITFQEEIGEEFDPIRQRLRSNSSRLRNGGPGFLAYSLIDTVVDRYFIVLEKAGLYLEDLEEYLMLDQPPNILHQVHHIKRELIFFRKHIWPVREVISSLQHADTELLDQQTQNYLRDVYDHTIQAMDTLETYRDLIGGIQDLYLSVLSNRMNEIMKVLTVISTIFIPLTFIVGVYGMNFKFMPELDQPWAYPTVWVIMIAIAIAMAIFFRRKRWI